MTNEERQQAIEWLKGRPITMPGAKKMFALAVEALEAYVPDTNVGDMISRQAAIDVATFECGKWKGLAKEITKQINALPSAQPERRCVNCGRTVNNGGWYADGRTRCPIEEHYALPKDGYCHLWEKRNITDDDYPERRTDGKST